MVTSGDKVIMVS